MPGERGQLKQASRTTPDLRFPGHLPPHPESGPAVSGPPRLYNGDCISAVEDSDAWRGVRRCVVVPSSIVTCAVQQAYLQYGNRGGRPRRSSTCYFPV